MEALQRSTRHLYIPAFALLFAFLLAFIFEGQSFYILAARYHFEPGGYVFVAMSAHLMGLLTSARLIPTLHHAYTRLFYCVLGILFFTLLLFFPSAFLWWVALPILAFLCGTVVAAFGHFLKHYATKTERMRACADVLIISNVLMIFINLASFYISPLLGLGLCLVLLMVSAIFMKKIRDNAATEPESMPTVSKATDAISLVKPLAVLCLFIIMLTISAGLMYQVINPAFRHLPRLISWYWAVPYVAALAILRRIPIRAHNTRMLYVGIMMTLCGFICFMFPDRSPLNYFLVNTFLLGASGILDLFWWRTGGDFLDLTEAPSKIFAFALGANVSGVLLGGIVGRLSQFFNFSTPYVVIIALTTICMTLILLPLLNELLQALLKSHTDLATYKALPPVEQTRILTDSEATVSLTDREKEVLQLILEGKSNRLISDMLGISENTTKTHVRNIYSKHHVSSRSQLLSLLLGTEEVSR